MATKQLSPVDVVKFFDTDGTPLANGKVYTYQSGSGQTIPLATYQDRDGAAANTNPITLDAKGEATIYLIPGRVYDWVIKDASLTTIRTRVGVSDGSSNMTVDGVGDGVTNDQAAFEAALAIGGPVYVPYTEDFYSLTSLTDAQRGQLWGPGRIKVAGVDTPIPSQSQSLQDAQPSACVIKKEWAPDKWPTVEGSLQNGAAFFDVIRTGGFGTYGNSLNLLRVDAALPAGQLDTAETAWVTATNLTGGQAFGSWFGANTPAKALGQTYSGGAVIGQEVNVGNRWADLGLQTDIGGTRYTVGLQVVADVLPASDGENNITVTSITIASPGVATVTAHGFPAWTGIVFAGAGTLPTGLVKGTLYYVASTGLATDTFQIAATVGGASINTTGSFAGAITVRPSYAGSFGTVTGRSVWAHRWWVGTLLRENSIMAGGYGHYAAGGTIAAMAPAAWTKAVGYWDRGLDMRGCQFATYGIDFQNAAFASGAVFNFDFTASNSLTATAGGIPIPSGFQAYLKASMNGTPIRIPYLLA